MQKILTGKYELVEGEEKLSDVYDILLFLLFGLGPSFSLLDAVYLELAWFETTQPDGLNLSAWISLAQAAAVCLVIPFFALDGWLHFEQSKVAMCLSIVAPTMTFLFAVTWKIHIGNFSVSILAISCLATVVGNLCMAIITPWVASTFEPRAISAFMAGNALIVCLEVGLQALQRPGGARIFSPKIYYFIAAAMFTPSILALFCIMRRNKSLLTHTVEGTLQDFRPIEYRSLCDQLFPSGWVKAVPYAAYYVISAMITWWVCTTILPYGASNTAGGGCENKGEDFLAWTITIGYASGLLGSLCALFPGEGSFFLRTSLFIQCTACCVVVVASLGWTDWTSMRKKALLFGAVCAIRFAYAWNIPLIFRELTYRYPENAEELARFVSMWTIIIGFPWLIGLFYMVTKGVFVCSP